jgi:hypothetical protein
MAISDESLIVRFSALNYARVRYGLPIQGQNSLSTARGSRYGKEDHKTGIRGKRGRVGGNKGVAASPDVSPTFLFYYLINPWRFSSVGHSLYFALF